MNTSILIDAERLRTFTAQTFEIVGVPAEDARIAADVLLASDLRGVESHGVSRLHHYIAHIKAGAVVAKTQLRVERELPAALSFDAGNGLGLVAGHRAMLVAIERAAQYGSAAVTVRRSNHFGIAGYHAMLALPHDMIGVAMSNASRLVVPFGGKEAMLGTNPMAWAVPCGAEPALVMDMATSGISYGKIEVALRTGKPMPLGWALGEDDAPTADASDASRSRRILPLGGLAEGTGYKGYALSTVVESLSHALAGASMSLNIRAVQGRGERPTDIGHFFAAYRIDAFRDLHAFKEDMDAFVRTLRSCPPQDGVERVFIPGEKEHLTALERARDGIPLHEKVAETLQALASELRLPSVV